MARVTLKTSRVYNAEAFRRRPETIRNSMSYEEMRAEYRALKDVANKRLARINRNNEVARYKGLEQFTRYGGFPSVKGLNAESLSVQLARLGDFLRLETSTAAGQKRADLRKMKELENSLGLKFKSREAFHEFTDYMEFMREASLKALYSSEQMVDELVGNPQEFSELGSDKQREVVQTAFEKFKAQKLKEAKQGEIQRLGEDGKRVKDKASTIAKVIRVIRKI